MKARIAPSILSADFACLGTEVKSVVAAGADLIHFDVMDNHYVPNLTIGPMVCAAIRPLVNVPIDVHLMVTPVDPIVADFAKAGANIITFHPEASQHIDRTIGLIHDCGCRAGLAFNPATPLQWLDHVLDKLAQARRRIDRTAREIWLEVDGGVKLENIAAIARAGADTFVAGSAIFGSNDYKHTIADMQTAIARAVEEAHAESP